jgi:hypothetical protein
MNIFLWVILPLAIASVLYATLAAGYFLVLGRPGMCLAFLGYILANIGFILDALDWKVS